MLKRARKKSYTVSVGKLNPAKLANFMEIECWVWVSCSEGMIDSKVRCDVSAIMAILEALHARNS